MPGMVLVAAGLLLFARVPVHGNYLTDVLPVMLLLGVGVGSSFPALMTLAMSDVAPEDAGLASGLVNTAGQVGGALGLAVLATRAPTHQPRSRSAGKPLATALTSGYHLAFLIGAGLIGIAILIGLALSSPSRARHRRARAPSQPAPGRKARWRPASRLAGASSPMAAPTQRSISIAIRRFAAARSSCRGCSSVRARCWSRAAASCSAARSRASRRARSRSTHSRAWRSPRGATTARSCFAGLRRRCGR